MILGTGPGQKYGSHELSAAVPANRHRVWLPCIQIRTGFDFPFPEPSNEIRCRPLPVGDFDFGSKHLLQPPGQGFPHMTVFTSLPAPGRYSWASYFHSIFVIVKMTLSFSLTCESPL